MYGREEATPDLVTDRTGVLEDTDAVHRGVVHRSQREKPPNLINRQMKTSTSVCLQMGNYAAFKREKS